MDDLACAASSGLPEQSATALRPVLCVVGTRPEAVKMAPVVHALRARGLAVRVVTTGQHPLLAGQALADQGVPVDVALPGSPTAILGVQLARFTEALTHEIATEPPGVVLVHGDTTSAVAGALAGVYARVPVAHVEAGLRAEPASAPFPEELNRRLIDHLSTLWFAPTVRAAGCLLQEGCQPDRVIVTGNTVVDALDAMVARVGNKPLQAFPALSQLVGRRLVVVTAHRRENVGEGLRAIIEAARRLASDGFTVVWPVHPNPDVASAVRSALEDVSNVVLLAPMPYPAFIRLLVDAMVVLTDSGGVLEEAACLGKPVLVLRSGTERPEVLETGVVSIVGTDPDAIVSRVTHIAHQPPMADPTCRPLGDGHASERIAAAVHTFLGAPA